MVTAIVLWVLAAPPTLDARLLRGTPSAESCAFERLSSTSTTVKWAWRANCGFDSVQQTAASKQALAAGNHDFSPVLLFDATRAVSVAPKDSAPFASELVDWVRGRLGNKPPPGYSRVSVDPTVRARWLMHDGALVRPAERVSEPDEVIIPRGALAIAPDSLTRAKSPDAPRPWAVLRDFSKPKTFHLQLADPSGQLRELLTRPESRSDNGSSIVATRLPNDELPTISVLAPDGSHTLFVPDRDRPGALRSTVFDRTPISLPAQPPAGSSLTPSPIAPHCSEATSEHVGEARSSPVVFEASGSAFVAYAVKTTRSRFRFTLVSRGGPTIDDDTLACEWVEDERASVPSLVVARVLGDATLEPRLQLQLLESPAQVTVDHGPGHFAVLLRGASLTVLSLEPGLLR